MGQTKSTCLRDGQEQSLSGTIKNISLVFSRNTVAKVNAANSLWQHKALYRVLYNKHLDFLSVSNNLGNSRGVILPDFPDLN